MSRSGDRTPGFESSFLDLLCSALGGIALLVFLFAAIRKNAETDAGVNISRRLQVQILAPYDFLKVGKDISLRVRDADGYEIALPHSGNLESSVINGKLGLRRPKSSSSKFLLEIKSRKDVPLEIDVWLRVIDAQHMSGSNQDAYQALLGGAANLRFELTWVSSQSSGAPDLYLLNSSKRFIATDRKSVV